MKNNTTTKRTVKVLIVEDEPFSRQLVTEALKNLPGLHVEKHLAGSLAETRSILTIIKPEVAFLDIGLPDGSGFELISATKAANPNCKIAMLTGRHTAADVQKARALGAVDYIAKPFNAKRLRAVVAGV